MMKGLQYKIQIRLYKINNIYKPYYSRMFMNDFPKYNEFFRMRTSCADEVDFSTIEKE